MTQAMTAPPVWSPWVLISAMREPSGVVYQDFWVGAMLSVLLSLAFGGVGAAEAVSLPVLLPAEAGLVEVPALPVEPGELQAASRPIRAASIAARARLVRLTRRS